uniref:Protein-L-isoaspartate O-methyltransferase domain-containing protein 1 n=2 Tax=Mesocestoides corti TaxID=53468 RepID=A0A5K3F7Q9_MESCO
MGAHASNFPDNQALIDSLKETSEVPSHVERVFRLVDRGFYSVDPNERIYSDSAWRAERLHLSSPGIYITVLCELDIRPGQSVLNIGSGTGYLSTIFGLLLGSNGVNHGIEVYESNVAFAQDRLSAFLANSDAVFEKDFCEPHFIVGNIFSLVPPSPHTVRTNTGSQSNLDDASLITEGTFSDEDSGDPDLLNFLRSSELNIESPPVVRSGSSETSTLEYWPTYDRIYVGSEISSRGQLEAILRLLKVGGRLIAPVYDQFVKIDRSSANRVNVTQLMNVSFASLVPPSENDDKLKPLPKRSVERLERLACRRLRRQLRQVITTREHGPPILGRFVEVDPCPHECSATDSLGNPNTFVAAASPDSSSSSEAGDSDRSPPERQSPCSQNFENTASDYNTGSSTGGSASERNENPEEPLTTLKPSTSSSSQKREASDSPSRNTGEREASPFKRRCDGDTASIVRPVDDEDVGTGVSDGEADDDNDFGDSQSALIRVRLIEHFTGNPRRLAFDRLILSGRVNVDSLSSKTENNDNGGECQESNARSTATDSGDVIRDKKKKKKRPQLKWVPQSYTYREEMRRLLEEELRLPEYICRLVFRVI